MDLSGQRVKHKSFGEGTVISQEGRYIKIVFNEEEKKFQYPDAFKSYIEAVDKGTTKQIKKDMNRVKEEKIAKQKKEREKRRKKRQEKKSRKTKSSRKSYPRTNVAFKCNYCDGGRSDEQIGFFGVCSDEIIRNNIEEEKRTWCSSDECACKQYHNGDINRDELDSMCEEGKFVCYESQMLRDWKAFAGVVQSGKNKGKPMKIKNVEANSLCVLTTRKPDSKESDRYIFAVFLIDDTYEGDRNEEGYVSTNSEYKIKLSPEESKSVPFWKYHSNNSRPEVALWSSGLHRYYKDEQAAQILRDIASLKKDTEEEELANRFYSHFCEIKHIDSEKLAKPDGALTRQ